MLNLGPASARMLAEVGIRDEEDLKRVGCIEAFVRVRDAGLSPSLNLLYAMEGALTGFKWNALPMDRRMALDMRVNFKRDLAAMEEKKRSRA